MAVTPSFSLWNPCVYACMHARMHAHAYAPSPSVHSRLLAKSLDVDASKKRVLRTMFRELDRAGQGTATVDDVLFLLQLRGVLKDATKSFDRATIQAVFALLDPRREAQGGLNFAGYVRLLNAQKVLDLTPQ